MRQLFISTLVTLFLSLTLYSNDEVDSSFITKFEYGAMLYNNPRGIGCNKCHGNNGKGMLIASYKERDKKTNQLLLKSIIVPSVNKLTLDNFRKKIMKKNKSLIMPTYFLTDEELSSIHFYITTLEK